MEKNKRESKTNFNSVLITRCVACVSICVRGEHMYVLATCDRMKIQKKNHKCNTYKSQFDQNETHIFTILRCSLTLTLFYSIYCIGDYGIEWKTPVLPNMYQHEWHRICLESKLNCRYTHTNSRVLNVSKESHTR